MNKPKILIIDDKALEDNYARRYILDVLVSSSNSIEYEMIPPLESYLSACLDKISSYDLILVDYKFDKLPLSLFKSGGSLYSVLRGYSKLIPIYLISVLKGDINKIGDFEYFIGDELLEKENFLADDVNYHKNLRAATTNKESLLSLLLVPDEDKETISALLTPMMKTTESNDDEISLTENKNIVIYNWLAHIFFEKDGPLVSEQGAALFLGISVDYFIKLKPTFETATYKGAFESSFSERWWISLLEDIVIDIEDPDNLLGNLPFKEASSQLLGAGDKDKSKCIVCDQLYPEALGRIKQVSDEQLYSVHIKCSEHDETLKSTPPFHNIRLICADK